MATGGDGITFDKVQVKFQSLGKYYNDYILCYIVVAIISWVRIITVTDGRL